MVLFGFGNILLAGLLLVNAIAILNEERFLARSMSTFELCRELC